MASCLIVRKRRSRSQITIQRAFGGATRHVRRLLRAEQSARRKGGTAAVEGQAEPTLENRCCFPPHPRLVALTFPRLSTSTGVQRPRRVRSTISQDRGTQRSRHFPRLIETTFARRVCPFYSNVRNAAPPMCRLISFPRPVPERWEKKCRHRACVY